jgi:hypothetical protein
VSKTTLAQLVRIAWRTDGRIIGRVVEERSAEVDRLDGLRKIGIDEVSFRRGQRYLTVVVDHETARVVWVQEGCDEATLERWTRSSGSPASPTTSPTRDTRIIDEESAGAVVTLAPGSIDAAAERIEWLLRGHRHRERSAMLARQYRPRSRVREAFSEAGFL